MEYKEKYLKYKNKYIELKTMHGGDLECKLGQFVTPTTYDISIYDNNKLIAIVGFNSKQKEGALFWQLQKKTPYGHTADWDEIFKYDSNEIKHLAREYLEKHNITFKDY